MAKDMRINEMFAQCNFCGKIIYKNSLYSLHLRETLVPHRPGFRLQNFVAPNGQFYVPIHTLVHPEGGPHANFRDITAITFSYPPLLPFYAPGPALLWSCFVCRHDQPMLHAVPPFWSPLAPLAERVELCINLAFLCVCCCDCTKTQPFALQGLTHKRSEVLGLSQCFPSHSRFWSQHRRGPRAAESLLWTALVSKRNNLVRRSKIGISNDRKWNHHLCSILINI